MRKNTLVVCDNVEMYRHYLTDNRGWYHETAAVEAEFFVRENLPDIVWDFWVDDPDPNLEIEYEDSFHAWNGGYCYRLPGARFVVHRGRLQKKAVKLNDKIIAALEAIELGEIDEGPVEAPTEQQKGEQ